MKRIIGCLLTIMLATSLALAQTHSGGGGGGGSLSPTTVAKLPVSPAVGTTYSVKDGASSTDCVTGHGTTAVVCLWTGSVWTALGLNSGALTMPLTFSGASTVPTGASLTFQSGSTFSCASGATCGAAGTFSAGAFASIGTGPWTTLTERANAITPAAGFDKCDTDSTIGGIGCSMNGQVTQGVVTGGSCQASQSCAAPLAKPLHVWAGSFTFSSTAQAVTGLATLCPNAILSVWASSQSHAYAYQISSISTAGFTITTTSNTDVWNWGVACF